MELHPTEILNVGLSFVDEVIEVGKLAFQRNKIYFEYKDSFLSAGLQISPLKLPLQPGVVTCDFQPFDGLYGVFNDSLPDGWGRLLLDRALRSHGIAHQRLTPLDRLAYVGKTGMGALVYYPESGPQAVKDEILNLDELADEMAKVLEGEESEVLELLYQMGGSSAGARPKIVAGYHPEQKRLIHGVQDLPEGYEYWLIKFASAQDQADIGRIEYAYSLMAKAAGLEMTDTKLFSGERGQLYFGTRRFDRSNQGRLHMHTASGLLQSSHRIPNLDYAVLMNLALELESSMTEVKKLFRIAAFNVFAHNRDDHGKNFSWLMDASGTWRTSPAYDLTYSFGPGGEHSTTILREGARPGAEQLEKLGEMFSITDRKEIIEEVRDAVSQWESFAEQSEVPKTSRKLIQKAIDSIH